MMFRKSEKTLNSRTPKWFQEWHSEYFKPVDGRSKRNERLVYLLIAAVISLNTAGNWYHEEMIEFIIKLFGG